MLLTPLVPAAPGTAKAILSLSVAINGARSKTGLRPVENSKATC
jgi:hypothetical protein